MTSEALEFPELPEAPELSREGEDALYELAIRAIRDSAEGAKEEDLGWIDEPPEVETPDLALEVGVFVTIFYEEELRGCLGITRATEPLRISVPRMAHAAASRDTRFPPVDRWELPYLRVEITILGPLIRLPNEPEVLLRRLDPEVCGVSIRLRSRSGLLLPQVAKRLRWGAKELLEQVCLKAGLSSDAWTARNVEILGFRARSLPPRPVQAASGEERS